MTAYPLPGMPEKPQEWLDAELDELGDLTGRTTGGVARLLIMRVPYQDMPYWARPGFLAGVRKNMRARGMVVNHGRTADEDEARSPLVPIGQLQFDELIAVVSHKHGQTLDLRHAAVDLIERWKSEHPENDVPVAEIMRLAGFDESETA